MRSSAGRPQLGCESSRREPADCPARSGSDLRARLQAAPGSPPSPRSGQPVGMLAETCGVSARGCDRPVGGPQLGCESSRREPADCPARSGSDLQARLQAAPGSPPSPRSGQPVGMLAETCGVSARGCDRPLEGLGSDAELSRREPPDCRARSGRDLQTCLQAAPSSRLTFRQPLVLNRSFPMVHVILGVRPRRDSAAGIPTVAWTIRRKS